MKEMLSIGLYSGFATEEQADKYARNHVDLNHWDYDIIWCQADNSWAINVY